MNLSSSSSSSSLDKPLVDSAENRPPVNPFLLGPDEFRPVRTTCWPALPGIGLSSNAPWLPPTSSSSFMNTGFMLGKHAHTIPMLISEDGSTQESVDKAKDGAYAFSYGARGCPGKNLAWTEMLVVVAKFVWCFEVRIDPGNDTGAGNRDGRRGRRVEGQYQTRDASVSLRHGPMVQFRRRL